MERLSGEDARAVNRIANRGVLFEDDNVETTARKTAGCNEPRRTGANDDGVMHPMMSFNRT